MKPFLLAATLSLAPLSLLADVTGTYVAQGRNPDGSRYTGTAWVTEDAGTVFVRWQVGSTSYTGAGPIRGDVVTVDWGQGAPVFYIVMPDGELHGTWADGTALEKLIPE